ncbi:MAG TPA: hypothetical protein VIR82_21295 [Bradyrhizobium sp.]
MLAAGRHVLFLFYWSQAVFSSERAFSNLARPAQHRHQLLASSAPEHLRFTYSKFRMHRDQFDQLLIMIAAMSGPCGCRGKASAGRRAAFEKVCLPNRLAERWIGLLPRKNAAA